MKMEEEILDVVDENDQFVRKATRQEVREKTLLHRVARVLIINKAGKFLVQKRSKNKDLFPNYWDIGVAETVKSGDGYESTATRGLMEELGIPGISNIQMAHSFLFKFLYNTKENNSITKVYKLIYDGKIILPDGEIENVRFLTEDELKKWIREEKFHPTGIIAFNKYFEIQNQNDNQ